jgi:hypothetical protein
MNEIETKAPPVKNLGSANGWRETPLELKAHEAFQKAGARHVVTEVRLGRCWTEYTCPTCGIRWNVDSSG